MALEDPNAARDPAPRSRPAPGNGTFVVLGKYTSLDALLSKDHDELSLARQIAETLGALADDVWFTTGTRDVVVILRNADARTALAFALAFGEAANVSTETLTAADAVSDVSNAAADALAWARLMRGGGGSD